MAQLGLALRDAAAREIILPVNPPLGVLALAGWNLAVSPVCEAKKTTENGHKRGRHASRFKEQSLMVSWLFPSRLPHANVRSYPGGMGSRVGELRGCPPAYAAYSRF